MYVINRAGLSPTQLAEVEGELSGQHNLSDVLEWAFGQSAAGFVPTVVAEVVVQDEYTHDVVVPWRDGLVLVYDTT